MRQETTGKFRRWRTTKWEWSNADRRDWDWKTGETGVCGKYNFHGL